MADVTVANTSLGIAGKTLACHDADGTTTGIWTFANPLALKSGVSGSQTWRLSVAGPGDLNVLADGTGAGLSLTTAGSVKFTGDISEKNRPVPMGHWVAFTPTIGVNVGSVIINTVVTSKYMLMGKSLTLSFLLAITVAGSPTRMILPMPAGFICPNNVIGGVVLDHLGFAGMIYATGTGVAQFNLFRDTLGAGAFINGSYQIAGTATFEVA